jgi:hypothetical protein
MGRRNRHDSVWENALTLVNVMRNHQGREPIQTFPMGEIGEPLNCPVSKSIHASVSCEKIIFFDEEIPRGRDIAKLFRLEFKKFNDRGYYIDTPPDIVEFINKFDQGGYPTLVEHERK